jgi:uncharacterized protein YjbJ (UPF0337 family)
MGSTSDKINGKTKQVVGKITNNKELEVKGKAEEIKGKVKSKIKHTSDRIIADIDDIKRA